MPPPEGSPIEPALPTRAETRSKRRLGSVIAIVLLSLALAAALAVLALYLVKLDDADTRIQDQEREIEEQRQLIEKKETFTAAMQGLLSTATTFDGVLLTSLVPFDRYESVAVRAWTHRWKPQALDRDIADVLAATSELEDLRAGASTEAATNSTGTVYETIIDQLGSGFVASVIDDADSLCEADVIGCVISDDPLTVHFDAADHSEPYMTDWIRTGVAYHEFAHVLQLTNPAPTKIALEHFGNDDETMADCFALTYLDGWTLDHRTWVSTRTYWDVNIGYGHVCTDVQRQALRDWYSGLGVQLRPISQQT